MQNNNTGDDRRRPSAVPRTAVVWLAVTSIAFAYVEAAVVVYLRSIYYPKTFPMPLVPFTSSHLAVELPREAATIVMLVGMGMLAGRSAWSRFGAFMIAFGLWDIFYYVWLHVALGWPASLLDWDILFLLPTIWLGPVLAPILVSLYLIVNGWLILRFEAAGRPISPPIWAWLAGAVGTVSILASFVDVDVKGGGEPEFSFVRFAIGMAFYLGATILTFRPIAAPDNSTRAVSPN